MGGSLKLSCILVLVLMLSPLLNEMEMVKAAAEGRKFEKRKMKELLPAYDPDECQIACENDGYWKGRCFSAACVCFEKKRIEAEEAEKRQASDKDRPDVQHQ